MDHHNHSRCGWYNSEWVCLNGDGSECEPPPDFARPLHNSVAFADGSTQTVEEILTLLHNHILFPFERGRLPYEIVKAADLLAAWGGMANAYPALRAAQIKKALPN